jgi:hypothetical protein
VDHGSGVSFKRFCLPWNIPFLTIHNSISQALILRVPRFEARSSFQTYSTFVIQLLLADIRIHFIFGSTLSFLCYSRANWRFVMAYAVEIGLVPFTRYSSQIALENTRNNRLNLGIVLILLYITRSQKEAHISRIFRQCGLVISDVSHAVASELLTE